VSPRGSLNCGAGVGVAGTGVVVATPAPMARKRAQAAWHPIGEHARGHCVAEVGPRSFENDRARRAAGNWP